MPHNKPIKPALSSLRFVRATLWAAFRIMHRAMTRNQRHTGKAFSMSDQLERNEQAAIGFYDLMFNQCKPAEAVPRCVGDVYIQHNPHLADGKHAFIADFERMAREYPGDRVHFKRAIADDNHVVLQCHQEWPGDRDRDRAGIEILRLDDNGKIVELRDVPQALPETSANDNPRFQPLSSIRRSLPAKRPR